MVYQFRKNFNKKGQSLIEIMIVIGMLALVLPALLTGMVASRSGKAQLERRSEAIALLKETQEAVKSIRERNWDLIATNGTYHPVVTGTIWELSSGADLINGLTRSLEISSVSRNSSGQIVTVGGTVDPSTKMIVVTISWTNPYASSFSSTLLLTRHKSLGVTQTTQSDFNGGSRTNTFVTNNQGGEVVLGAGGGGGDWCIPSFQVTDYTLLRNGVNNAITATDTNTGARVYIGTGENSSGTSFTDVKLSNTDPPNVLSSKSFDGYKTNGIFGESNADGTVSFAYLATDTNNEEVVILDLNQFSNPPTNTLYYKIGIIDLPGNGNADVIYVVNNKAYVIGVNKLYIYNLPANRDTTASPAVLQNSGGYTLSGTGKEIVIGTGGQYAYVMTNATTNNFEIINISNPASPTRESIRTIGSSQAGIDLSVTSSETVVYAAVAYSAVAGTKNVYRIDTTDKSNPVVGLGYNTGGMSPTAITYVTGNRLIVVGTGGTYQYHVLNSDLMDLCSPTSALQYANGVKGIASILQASNGYAYSYINVSENNSPKLKIILGGAGGQFVSSGTFTSSTIDSGAYTGGNTTAFNGFSSTISQPNNTTMRMQVAVASPINGSCAGVTNFTFVGPDGDTSEYFEVSSDPNAISGVIPLMSVNPYYNNPGRCFRYKVWYETIDPAFSPTLYDFTVSFSP